jgi:hypothetical protein
LAAGALLVGCASTHKASSAAAAAQAATAAVPPAPSAAVTGARQAAGLTAERPGAAEGELVVVTAKVKAIDAKNRVVTLKYPDGKEAKIKCGPEVRNFPQIRVGDDVTAEFLETVELFVAGPEGAPTAGSSSAMQRAPLGAKPEATAVDVVQMTATVEDINYDTRMVKLRGPDGDLRTVKAGPEVKRLNEVKRGDTVVARLTEAVSIRVTAPK